MTPETLRAWSAAIGIASLWLAFVAFAWIAVVGVYAAYRRPDDEEAGEGAADLIRRLSGLVTLLQEQNRRLKARVADLEGREP